MLGAVGDVDDAEEVAPAGGVVDRDQQLAEEQVFVGRGAERALEHVLAEQRGLVARVRSLAHARSIRSWRSAKARSRTSSGHAGAVEAVVELQAHLVAQPARARGQPVGHA